jgi:hypothetical protein
MTLIALSEMELIGIYLLAAVAGLGLFYLVIRGAVQSGTKDIVEELRKQRPNSTTP